MNAKTQQPEFKIDPKMKALLPPLDADAQKELRASIQKEGGAYEPLTVWKEKGILIDGHNRWAILSELNKSASKPYSFTVEERSFKGEQEARIWALSKQLGRRNLTKNAMKLYRGQLYNLLKGDPKGNLKQNASGSTSKPKTNAAKVVAKKTGTSARQVKRDGKYATGLEKIKEAKGDEAAQKIVKGETKTTAAQVEAVASAKSEEERKKAIEAAFKPAEKPKAAAKAKDTAKAPKATQESSQKADDPEKFGGNLALLRQTIIDAARKVSDAKSDAAVKKALPELREAFKALDEAREKSANPESMGDKVDLSKASTSHSATQDDFDD